MLGTTRYFVDLRRYTRASFSFLLRLYGATLLFSFSILSFPLPRTLFIAFRYPYSHPDLRHTTNLSPPPPFFFFLFTSSPRLVLMLFSFSFPPPRDGSATRHVALCFKTNPFRCLVIIPRKRLWEWTGGKTFWLKMVLCTAVHSSCHFRSWIKVGRSFPLSS